jgi:glutathione S-transferase
MAIKLYDAVPSTNSDRVKIALNEKGLAYERVSLNLARRDQKRPEFLKLNPYGKVPVIDDGGKVLFESCIINEYLDEKYPDPPLMPKDPFLRARGRIIVDYGMNHLHETYFALRNEFFFKKEGERDQKLIAEKQIELRGMLGYLEAALGDKEYFLGAFSLTDVDLWPRIGRLEDYGALPSPELPRLGAWIERMKARPSIKALVGQKPAY